MGLVGNARYMEMADFVLGFAGIDIAGDDGRKLGQSPGELDTPFAWARDDPEPIYTHCERCGGRVYAPGLERGPGGWSPVASIRHIFIKGEPEAVCHCPAGEHRAVARRPRRRVGVAMSLPRIPSVPARAPEAPVKMLPEDCPVRQAIEGKSRMAYVADGGAAAAKTAWAAGKVAWKVGSFAVRVVLAVPRVIAWMMPDRPEQEPGEREPSRRSTRTARARRDLPRP